MWWKSEIRFKKVWAVFSVSNDFRTVSVAHLRKGRGFEEGNQ